MKNKRWIIYFPSFISIANIQKSCSDDWKKLDESNYKFYQEQANEISKNQESSSTKYIENAKSRSTVLNKGILNVKKIVSIIFCLIFQVI